MGHADLNTTRRYAHVADPTVERDYRQVMARLEQEPNALSLVPVSLEALLRAAGGAARLDRVKLPLDNSM